MDFIEASGRYRFAVFPTQRERKVTHKKLLTRRVMNWCRPMCCSVVERLLCATVGIYGTVIRISRYVSKPMRPVHQKLTPGPREAWTAETGPSARGSKLQPRSSVPPALSLPSGRVAEPHRAPPLLSSMPFHNARTTSTGRESADDRQSRGKVALASRPTRDAGSLDARRPSTIVVYMKGPPRQEQRSDTNCTARDDSSAVMQSLHEETVCLRSPMPGFVWKQSAARSDDEDGEERREVVGPVFEKLQTHCDTTTELTSALTSPPRRQQDTRTTLQEAYETVQLSEVPDEKLQLLEKLVAGGHLALDGAKVIVEVREKRIRVGGTADQIETARTTVLEVLPRVCCEPAGLSQNQLQLLMSDRGQRWFDDVLAQNGGRVVVLFNKEATGYIVGEDDGVVSHTKSVLQKSLSTEKIPFGTEVSKFLHSSEWADAVEKYESKWFVRVTRDDSAGLIVLDGSVREVADVGVEVRQLLGQNSRTSRKIQLKSGDYRLIKQHLEADVSQCLKNQQG